ncbi:MAG TPA: ABC transporter permease [Polyangiaceae bacterium]|jgi:peptide/nickel transport system permease protein
MLAYLVRRAAYGVLVVFGVLMLLFALFFGVTKPDDIARRAIGEKAMPSVIAQWKKNHGYDRPLWPGAGHLTDNLLVDHFRKMLTFDFGRSDADDTPIINRIKDGAGPSLSLTLPEFTCGIGLGLIIALFLAFFRETYIDRAGLVLGVLGMSVSVLLYIIGGQFLIGKLLRWFPISGFDSSWLVRPRFLMLPVIVGIAAYLGSDTRFYRTLFVEEIHRDYVRTARAKGAGEIRVMARHVLRNALIPILTGIVISVPTLFMGSLLLENAFGIPGLGSLTVDAITGNDFATLRAIVFIGSLLLVGGQILTDITYTLADPRIRLE